MWALHFVLIVTAFTLGLLGIERPSAKQYQPDTREALFIRPQSATQRVLPPVRCLAPVQATKIVSFSIRDKAGKIVATGSFEVREEC